MSGIYLMLFGLCIELCFIGQNDGHYDVNIVGQIKY